MSHPDGTPDPAHRRPGAASPLDVHIDGLEGALEALRDDVPRLERWGVELAGRLTLGGRLLVAGNGGSAAQAQHLTAELVGRYRAEREPLSAVALHADTSTLTALTNDYGAEMAFARQVEAHGRPGDLLLALSTSGRSPNVLRAAATATALGMEVWALCGRPGGGLDQLADDAVTVDAATPTVQEVHQVCLHLLCDAVDRAVAAA